MPARGARPCLPFVPAVLAVLAVAMVALPAHASTQAGAPPPAPGGSATILGMSGVYECIGRGPAAPTFAVTAFEDGLYRFEETGASEPTYTLRYPWQLVGTTAVRERLRDGRVWKFRKMRGSLEDVAALPVGETLTAFYVETSLDGRDVPIEWSYELTVSEPKDMETRAAGRQTVFVVEERRFHQVDRHGQPVSIDARPEGGSIVERRARFHYVPAIGLAVIVEETGDSHGTRFCELVDYRRAN